MSHPDPANLMTTQQWILREVEQRFAPEDEVLQQIGPRAQTAGLPAIAISPLEGRLLQVLLLACQARRVLEIGALGGYSGTWLARALPADGQLTTLELDQHHADIVAETFRLAGVSERTRIIVGPALESLPSLQGEDPFDLVFIDADKENYPGYLDWAIKLARPGAIIVADNTIRQGKAFAATPEAGIATAVAAYNERAITDPRLLSIALPLDDEYTDGFTISVVRSV